MRKRTKIITLILAVLIIIGGVLTSPFIFQEGNPLPLFYGIGMLHLTDKQAVKIGDNRYVSKSLVFKDSRVVVSTDPQDEWTYHFTIDGTPYGADWNIYLGRYYDWKITKINELDEGMIRMIAYNYLNDADKNTIIDWQNAKVTKYKSTDDHNIISLNNSKVNIKGTDTYKVTFEVTKNSLLGPISVYVDKEWRNVLGVDERE